MSTGNKSVKTPPQKKSLLNIGRTDFCLNFKSQSNCNLHSGKYTSRVSLNRIPKTGFQQNKPGFSLLILTSRKNTLIVVNDTME